VSIDPGAESADPDGDTLDPDGESADPDGDTLDPDGKTPDRRGTWSGSVVVIGEAVRSAGFALAGATVLPAEDGDTMRRAWAARPDDTVVVVLTPKAAEVLAQDVAIADGVLTVVMPP